MLSQRGGSISAAAVRGLASGVDVGVSVDVGVKKSQSSLGFKSHLASAVSIINNSYFYAKLYGEPARYLVPGAR